jgi:hypothetical protein
MNSKRPVTTAPAEKYGPTDLYDTCEASACDTTARLTCPACAGHFCRTHAEHHSHSRT